ncbi:MAG: DUF4388 domain-containing protein [Candidatus Eisenbacteria bacterium]
MNGRPDSPRPAAGPNDLIGSLQVVALIDLCQFLLLNRKTGTLALFHRGGVSRLFFRSGEIVNGLDESLGREGRDVALSLFRIREGGFRFRQEEVHEKRRIEEGTENLLLEAARKMDEIGEALPSAGEKEGSREKNVREKQEKGEALQRLFSTIEEDLGRNTELPGLEEILRQAEEGGADGVLLAVDRPPLLLRANRVLRALPGVLRADDLAAFRRALEGRGAIPCGNAVYRASGGAGEDRILLGRRGKTNSLAEVNLSPARVESLLAPASGVLLLIAEAPPARRLLLDGVLHLLAERNEIVAFLGEKTGGEEKGLVLFHPLERADTEETRSIDRLLAGIPAARIVLPQPLGGAEARLLLDLSRRGHFSVTTLPGRDGGDALRRAASWFREGGSLQGLAANLAGVVSLRLLAGATERLVPVTSAAPVRPDARAALEREDFAGFSASLERAAEEDGFSGSIRRLVEGRHVEKSEADRIASLLSSLVMEEA